MMTSKYLHKIIKNVAKKITPFSGNCGIFAIALAEFLKSIGKYDMRYLVYVNTGENSVEDYFLSETDIYHVILSVEGEGIDDFFDGHGSCSSDDVLGILREYGLDFDSVSVLNLKPGDRKAETFIRNNTNCDVSDQSVFLKLFQKEYKKLFSF